MMNVLGSQIWSQEPHFGCIWIPGMKSQTWHWTHDQIVQDDCYQVWTRDLRSWGDREAILWFTNSHPKHSPTLRFHRVNVTYRRCSGRSPPGLRQWSNPVSSPPRGRCAGSCSSARTGSKHAACSSYLQSIEKGITGICPDFLQHWGIIHRSWWQNQGVFRGWISMSVWNLVELDWIELTLGFWRRYPLYWGTF